MPTEIYDPIEETAEEQATIKAGLRALKKIGQTFNHWLTIARALDVGRQLAARQTEDTVGGRYNLAILAWLKRHPQFEKIDKAARSNALWVLDNLAEVEEWRASLDEDARLQFNHPTTIRRKVEASYRRLAPKEDKVGHNYSRTALMAERMGAIEDAHSALNRKMGHVLTVVDKLVERQNELRWDFDALRREVGQEPLELTNKDHELNKFLDTIGAKERLN